MSWTVTKYKVSVKDGVFHMIEANIVDILYVNASNCFHEVSPVVKL